MYINKSSLTSQVKKMIDEPVSVIIPTWNSLPEFEICLKWLKKSVPRNVLDEIIVIDRYSNDGTVEVAKKYGCVLHQSNSILGKARMEGIQLVKNKIILFVDSDILLSPKWFERIQKYWDEKTGMLCGRTIDDSNKLGKMLVWKMNRDLHGKPKLLKKGIRGKTHNTFIRKELVIDCDISYLSAWEDWMLTQSVLEKGYLAKDVPVPCIHLTSHTLGKFGDYRQEWNVKGMLRTVGIRPYSMGFLMYPLMEGFLSTFHFKDLFYLKWGIREFNGGIRGLLKCKNVDFKREKK